MSDYNHYDDQYEDQDYNYADCQVDEYDNESPDMDDHNANQSVYDDYGQQAYTTPIDYSQYQTHDYSPYEPQHPNHTDQYHDYDQVTHEYPMQTDYGINQYAEDPMTHEDNYSQLEPNYSTHPNCYSQHVNQYPMHNDHYGEYFYVSNIYHNPPEDCAAETYEYDGNTESLALHQESMVPEPPTVDMMYASPPKTINHQMGVQNKNISHSSLSTFERDVLEKVYAKLTSMQQDMVETGKISEDIQSQTRALSATNQKFISDLNRLNSTFNEIGLRASPNSALPKVRCRDANENGSPAKLKVGDHKSLTPYSQKKSRAVVKWNNNVHGPFGHYKTIPNSSNQTWNSSLKHGKKSRPSSSDKQFVSDLYKDKSNVYGPSGRYKFTSPTSSMTTSRDSGTQLVCKTTNVKGPMAKYKNITLSSDSFNPNINGLMKDASNASGPKSKYKDY